MDDTRSFPESVSYRQLASWLEQAPPDPSGHGAGSAGSEVQEDFEALLEQWSRSGLHILAALKENGKAISEGRSPRQMMALGALQAHLTMALQARAASGRSPE